MSNSYTISYSFLMEEAMVVVKSSSVVPSARVGKSVGSGSYHLSFSSGWTIRRCADISTALNERLPQIRHWMHTAKCLHRMWVHICEN